jgi:lipopolysaccharide export system ATP-binding protein
MSLLKIEGLSLELGGKLILSDLNWSDSEVGSGLLGPNGAGKSTLFRCVMGLQRYHEGRILWEGEDLIKKDMGERRKAGIAYLAQEPWLFSELSSLDNLRAISELLGLPATRDVIESLLKKVGLEERSTHVASTLSGGEKRRLEIARVLLEEPKLIMMDEPFAGLDPRAIRLLKGLLESLKGDGLRLLISDHQVDHILDVCEEVTLMNQGKISLRSSSQSFKEKEGAQRSYL